MEFDLDLCRKILMEVEAKSDPFLWEGPPQIESYSDGKILYHVWLLSQEGLLEAKFPGGHFSETCAIRNLTLRGHQFLAALRDSRFVGKFKRWAFKRGGSLLFSEAVKWGLEEARKLLAP
jgi:hypothetical protein